MTRIWTKRFIVTFLLMFALISVTFGQPSGLRVGSAADTTSSITQYGITWTFSEPVPFGQFVNGDYWVVGPVQITDINPASITNGVGRVINGSMVDPAGGIGGQGYDSSASAFVSSSNVGMNVSETSPLSLDAGNSLVSTISRDPAGMADTRYYGYGPSNPSRVMHAAVLTVLSGTPPAGSFRPTYANAAKTIYNINDVNWPSLQRLSVPANAPSMTDTARRFSRVHLNHVAGHPSGESNPIYNMDWYGEYISRAVGIGGLMLNLSYTDEQKRDLLIGFVQVGIDNYGVVQSNPGGYVWQPQAGFGQGRKLPILVAGKLLGDPGMLSLGSGDGSGVAHFGEDGQTGYVTQEWVDMSNSTSWNPDDRAPLTPYDSSMIGMPEWTKNGVRLLEFANANWAATYRRTNTARAWPGTVLTARIMGLKNEWAHDALFDYQDRYMAIENGDSDPFGYAVPGEDTGWRSNDAFTETMWDLYRSAY